MALYSLTNRLYDRFKLKDRRLLQPFSFYLMLSSFSLHKPPNYKLLYAYLHIVILFSPPKIFESVICTLTNCHYVFFFIPAQSVFYLPLYSFQYLAFKVLETEFCLFRNNVRSKENSFIFCYIKFIVKIKLQSLHKYYNFFKLCTKLFKGFLIHSN